MYNFTYYNRFAALDSTAAVSSCDPRPLLNCYEQEDPALVELVRGTIIPPSAQPYNLSESGDIHAFCESRSSVPDDLSLDMEQTYLKDVTNGFFIEAGASEGNDDTVDQTRCEPLCARRGGLPHAAVRGAPQLDRSLGGAHGQWAALQTPQGDN